MRILFAEAVAVEEEDMERMNRLVMKAIVQMVKATTGTRPGENDSSSLNHKLFSIVCFTAIIVFNINLFYIFDCFLRVGSKRWN